MTHDLDYIAVNNKLGEGIVANSEKILWVDIQSNESFEFLLSDKNTFKYKHHFKPTFSFLSYDGSYLFSAEGVYKKVSDTFTKQFDVNLKKGNRSNDGRVDFNGNLWASSMKENTREKGEIIFFDKQIQRKFVEKISIPNSICFDKKRNRGYFSDSLQKKIFMFDMNTYTINKYFETELGEPDGAILDDQGNMHVCIWGQSAIYVISPKGLLIEKIKLPEKYPTCLAAFKMENEWHLAVTSASEKSQLGKTMVIKSRYNFLNEFLYEQ